MKKNFKYYAGLLLVGAAMVATGCSDDEAGIVPSDITNLRAESTNGRIVLRWDTPTDAAETIRYIEVNYHDHLLKKDAMRTASIYADSIEIPDTRQKYGEYNFSVQTVSPTGDRGSVQTISKVSEPALPTYVYNQIPLKASDLYTNAQEPSEGPIANLLDGNTGTFFHTAWSVGVEGWHYMEVKLHQQITDYSFYYAPRNNANNKPTWFYLEGRQNGGEWFLIKEYTKDADGLPTTSTGTYTAPVNTSPKPFDEVKITVYETNNGSVFWTMSEFKFYSVSVDDPEAPDAE